MLEFKEEKQLQKVNELHYKEAEDLAQILSQKYQLPYIDLTKFAVNTDALRLIDENDARAGRLAAFKLVGKNIYIVTTSPEQETAQKILAGLKDKGYRPELHLASEASLERAWSRYEEISHATRTEAGMINLSPDRIKEFLSAITDLNSFKDKFATITANPEAGGTSDILEIILAGGLVTGASDIHFEPVENSVRLRYRLDGVLHDITFLQSATYHRLLSRIKLISGLKLNITSAAQDGRFSLVLPDTEIEFRVSILPGAYGESVVTRILNPDSIRIGFDNLGLD